MPPAPEPQLRTRDGLDVLVRAPTNYRAGFAHPLLVVYAAAGMTARATERLTGFTPLATRAGYIVAYPQHVRPSRRAMHKLAKIPAAVSAEVCIDQSRIYVTGHSDGGTAATAIAILPDIDNAIAGVAPSAAGFTLDDLAEFKCPNPRPVMIWHGAQDRLFPGWGRQAATWWARCNQCEPPPNQSTSQACVMYPRCAAPVAYCEHARGHTHWSNQAAPAIIAFFNGETR